MNPLYIYSMRVYNKQPNRAITFSDLLKNFNFDKITCMQAAGL